MNKFVMRCTVLAAALAIAASAATAEERIGKKKKRGFFDTLFGLDGSFKKKKKRRNPNWSGDLRVYYGSSDDPVVYRRNKKFIVDGDPEVSAGLGLGNLDYVGDKLVPLTTALKEARPGGIAEAAIYDALTGAEPIARVVQKDKDAILTHYISTGFKPLWTIDGKLAPRALPVLKLLGDAASEGLDPANYLPAALASHDPATIPESQDWLALARIDIGLTAMALKYAGHASGGQFDPRRLSRYNDLTPERVPAPQALKVLAWSPYPDAYLASLQPQHPAYGAMKKALAGLRAEMASKTFTPIAEGNRVKPGKSDPRIALLRLRLQELGLQAEISAETAEDPSVLDSAMSAMLKAFQKSEGIKATGALDNATIGALNNNGSERDLRRLTYNMERLRWLPKNLGSKYVQVNAAAFEVRVIDRGGEIWRSKVIAGKPNSQTSAFHDQIEMVVFNPSWGVPPSIIAHEYLPKLRRDPSYLDRQGFKVITKDGTVVPSAAIEWWNYGSKVPFSIQQPPGAKNALGELKFLFPNKHNIYMHDTPSRELFDDDERAFSHGCVRVQNPREFATILLGWDREKVDKYTDSRKSQTVKVNPVPVHITYFTAWPDESGKMNYYKDLYGRDETMEKALSGITLAQR